MFLEVQSPIKKTYFHLKISPSYSYPKDDESTYNCGNLGDIIQEKVKWFIVDGEVQIIGLGVEGVHSPSFKFIQDLAKEIIKGLDLLIQEKLPLGYCSERRYGKRH